MILRNVPLQKFSNFLSAVFEFIVNVEQYHGIIVSTGFKWERFVDKSLRKLFKLFSADPEQITLVENDKFSTKDAENAEILNTFFWNS